MASRRTSSRRAPGARRPGRPAGRTAADGLIADRDTLLEAAERIISRQGPAVSLEAIAVEAGVTKPILYRGVGDRDALVNALAERMTGRMAAHTAELVARASSPRAATEGFVRGYLESAARDRHLYLFVTAGGAHDDRVQQSLLLADRAARLFADGIAAYRTERGADPSVATVWSYGLLGALHYATLWYLRDNPDDMTRVIDQITALLWSGMGLDDAGDH